MRKSLCGQVYCIDLLKRIQIKFSLYFFEFYIIFLQILEIYSNFLEFILEKMKSKKKKSDE
jgi:hypothetical protein